jgi:hypothetical protein
MNNEDENINFADDYSSKATAYLMAIITIIIAIKILLNQI